MATENKARRTEILRPSDVKDVVLDDVVLVAVAADPPETDVLTLCVDHRIVDDPHALCRQTAAPGAAPLQQPAPRQPVLRRDVEDVVVDRQSSAHDRRYRQQAVAVQDDVVMHAEVHRRDAVEFDGIVGAILDEVVGDLGGVLRRVGAVAARLKAVEVFV